MDSGKSTLVGVLSRQTLDDGRGSARSSVFNYTHEAENGRTSSIGQEIIGFTGENEQVVVDQAKQTSKNKNASWGHIVSNSKKLITFIDLCGHEKYLKTTMFGLVGLLPDYGMIMVGANMGVSKMTREHLGISLALKIPFFIVVTKIDIAPPEIYEKTVNKLIKILKKDGVGKLPILVKDDMDLDQQCSGLQSGKVVPIFRISNVTGEGLDQLKEFLPKLKS